MVDHLGSVSVRTKFLIIQGRDRESESERE